MFTLYLAIASPLHSQELQHFGINEFDSRSIGLGLTGIVDAYGPLSVLRNPALNRSGRALSFKPFFQWVGNNKWDDVNDLATGSSSVSPDNITGFTSRYFGGVVQGKGITVGFIHSNRDELRFEKDGIGLFDPPPIFYGKHVESDFLFAGYTLKVTNRGRVGILLKNFRLSDTGVISDSARSFMDRDDIDRFFDESGSLKETTVGIDLGGLFAMNILRRPITVGVSVNNVVTDSLFGISQPTFFNAGVAMVPFNGLLIEANIVSKLNDDNNDSDSEFRFGVEYIFSGLRIRSGLAGENVSFGAGIGGEGLSLDYGAIEVDHNGLSGGRKKETYQSFQISLTGRFY